MANDLNVIINLLVNSKGLDAAYKQAAISQVALNRELSRGNAAVVNATGRVNGLEAAYRSAAISQVSLNRELSRGNATLVNVGRDTEGLERRFDSLGRTMRSIARYAATAFGIFAFQRGVVGTKEILADYQDFETRLKFLSTSAEAYSENLAFLDRLSIEHGKSILTLGDGYSRVAALIRVGTLTMQQGQTITEGLSNAQSGLGATSGQLELVMYGLGQALSQPVVQTAEFNQVVEPLPALMGDLTKAAGLTTGSYRDLVLAGKVTSAQFRDDLIKALANYDGAAKANINNIRAQENAFINMRAKAVKAFEEPIKNVYGDLLTSTGEGLKLLADNADTVTDTLGYLITFGFIRGASALTNYTLAQGIKIAKNREELATNLQVAESELAKNIQLQNTARLQVQAALSSAQHSKANAALAAANVAVKASQETVNLALARYSVVATTATAVGRGLLSVMGGVPGLVLLGGYALYSYASAANEASSKTDTLSERLYNLQDAYDGLNNATVRNEIVKNTREAITLGDRIDELAQQRQNFFNFRANTTDDRTYSQYSQSINRLTLEINQLTQKRAALLNTNSKLANTEQNLNNLKYQSVGTSSDENDNASELIKLRDEQEKQATTLLNNLKRQTALYGDVSHEATIRYELESGKLTVINDQLREKLILEAKQLDALAKQKKFQDEYLKVVKSVQTPTETENATNKNNLGILNQALAQTPESEVEKRAQIHLLIQAEERRHATAIADINQKSATEYSQLWERTVERFSAGIGDSVASALFESENLSEGLRNVLLNVAKQAVSSLIQIQVQRAVMSASSQALTVAEGTTAAATAASTGPAIAASMAPAAGFTSLASFGSNSIAAIAGMLAVATLLPKLFAGLFDKGGNIGAGQFGIVGEYGPEIVRGPANVTSRADTARLLNRRASNDSGGNTYVTIHDQKTFNVSGGNTDEVISRLQPVLDQNNENLINRIGKEVSNGTGPVYNGMRRALA